MRIECGLLHSVGVFIPDLPSAWSGKNVRACDQPKGFGPRIDQKKQRAPMIRLRLCPVIDIWEVVTWTY
jgi:hypothetical protein